MPLALLTCFVSVVLSADPAPWHLDGWTCRAVVTIPEPLADRSVDTAAVRVLCQGQAQASGNDYRVVDAAGQPVPFQLMFHDAARYSLISFRVTNVAETYYVYFGNPAAARAAEQVVMDAKPGAGPPSGDWVPRYGLVYTTLRRPEGDNPKTVADLASMLAASTAADGARYQRQISDGFNPFGSSDNYMSVYRGWIEIPAAGRYRFCTASNEASFSFLDGKELVHWPGRHTEERGIHGEKNAAVELIAGRHYVEYYHEEVALQQMAFLGWSPPGAVMEQFSGIPESVFVAPHQALVARYETPTGRAPRFEPAIVDTIWPELRREGQYTRCRFRIDPAGPLGESATYRWDFGDGQSALGAEVEHVYLAVGNYTVKLAAENAPGDGGVEWPLVVYEVQHVTDQIHEGDSAAYVKMVSGYDRSRLDAAALKELAHLLAESGEPKAAIDVGGEFIGRFAADKPDWLPGVRRLMADCALQLGGAQAARGPLDSEKLDEAIANYLASLTDATPAAERFDVLARLVKLLGIDRDSPDKALQIFGQAEAAAKATRLDVAGLAAYRKTIIAAGDVRLWHAEPERARTLYRKAEALAARPIAPQVRSAQVGAYPNLIRQFIETGDFGAALDVVDRWENNFPTEKLAGQTFFWRGKLLALRGQHQYATRHLARAVGLAVGAGFESEARWLLAQSLGELGRADDARRELAKLVAAGFGDDFAERAKKQLSEGTSQ
ncbi:MAG TPA: PKD domain-containing protein [Pirellulales bacterium]|nr:PKD domain-containing protein [Pirellulales bacterium]